MNKRWLPIAGLTVLAVLAVVLVGGAMTAGRTADVVASPTFTPTPEQTTTGPERVAFVGDSYTAGSGMDSGSEARWTTLLSAERGWIAGDFAEGGSGFIPAGTQGTKFSDRLADIVEFQPDTVIIAGGSNDISQNFTPAQVNTVAREFIQSVKTELPDARLIILSPFWRSAPPSAITEVTRNGEALSTEFGAQFVDVSTLFSAPAGLIGSDGVHPTDEGHRVIFDYLAQQIPAEPAA